MQPTINKAYWKKYLLHFKKPSGTSRGVLTSKPSYFVFLENENGQTGIGECNIIPGLSPDEQPELEQLIDKLCQQITTQNHPHLEVPKNFPAVQFAFEMALLDLKNGGKRILFPTEFTKGATHIPINGLVWMGDVSEMENQIREKIEQGFKCIKLKIGAIDWAAELQLLKAIRKKFAPESLEIRVDANGAFDVLFAGKVLDALYQLNIHSIEQPIKAAQWKEMAVLCSQTPVPIALDEELIGLQSVSEKENLLKTIKPQYIILKPSLTGGFQSSDEWIEIAEQNDISWWATSALESNIGLNAIAQWCATKQNNMPQGLGTGQLFTNNFPSPLELDGQLLFFKPEKKWDLSLLNNA